MDPHIVACDFPIGIDPRAEAILGNLEGWPGSTLILFLALLGCVFAIKALKSKLRKYLILMIFSFCLGLMILGMQILTYVFFTNMDERWYNLAQYVITRPQL